MKRKIAIDCGKGFTKTAINRKNANEKTVIKTYKFPSRITEGADERDPLMTDNSFYINLDGEEYIVGDDGTKTTEAESTKKDIIHKVCAMTAIARLVDNGDEVTVIIGIPASMYKNANERESYRDYLIPSGTHKVRYKDTNLNQAITKTFTITDVKVAMEGSGVKTLFYKEMADELVGVIDIGNWNINAMLVDDGKIDMTTVYTNANGYRSFLQSLTNAINGGISTDLTLSEVERKLRKSREERYFKNRNVENAAEKSKEIIDNQIRDYIQGIVDTVKWDIENTTTYFVGGTSKLLKDDIINFMQSKYNITPIIPDTDDIGTEFINVVGFLQMLGQ